MPGAREALQWATQGAQPELVPLHRGGIGAQQRHQHEQPHAIHLRQPLSGAPESIAARPPLRVVVVWAARKKTFTHRYQKRGSLDLLASPTSSCVFACGVVVVVVVVWLAGPSGERARPTAQQGRTSERTGHGCSSGVAVWGFTRSVAARSLGPPPSQPVSVWGCAHSRRPGSPLAHAGLPFFLRFVFPSWSLASAAAGWLALVLVRSSVNAHARRLFFLLLLCVAHTAPQAPDRPDGD